jgi:hypothetical protein
MDKERLTAFAEWIRRLPSERFSMAAFVGGEGIDLESDPAGAAEILAHNCGTTGCIAGWATVWAAEQGIQSADTDSFGEFMMNVFDLPWRDDAIFNLIYTSPHPTPHPADAAEAILRLRDGKAPWGVA